MKTLRFGKINIKVLADGDVLLCVSSPGEKALELQLTPDELMLFLTEVGNQLAVSRDVLLRLREQKDILHERRRSNRSQVVIGERDATYEGDE